MQFIQFTAARGDNGQAAGASTANLTTADAAGQVSVQAVNGTYDAELTSADGLYSFPTRIKMGDALPQQ